MAIKTSILEALEMARQLRDKLNSLNRTRYIALATTSVEEAIHWLKDESEAD
jgi:hypothetical protein